MYISKLKLNKALKQRLSNIRRNLSMHDDNYSFSRVQSSSKDLIKMLLSFGSKKSSRIYYNNFIDVVPLKIQMMMKSKDFLPNQFEYMVIYQNFG